MAADSAQTAEPSAPDGAELARQLDDIVACRLQALRKQLDSLMPAAGGAEVQRRIGEAVADLDAIVADLRVMIIDLHGADADAHGVEAQLRGLALRAGQQLGCIPRVTCIGDVGELDPGLIAELTAVAGEALTNVVRHAYAGTIEVDLARVDGTVRLEVRDDGVGPNDEPTGGNGLSDMQARAEALGGTFVIEPNEPLGTRVLWSVPS